VRDVFELIAFAHFNEQEEKTTLTNQSIDWLDKKSEEPMEPEKFHSKAQRNMEKKVVKM